MGLTNIEGVNLGTAYAEIVVDFSKVQQAANTAFSNLERGLAPKINALGQNMQTVGRNITLMTAPLTAFVTQGIFAFADFDEILTEIQARTGATADEMETLKNFAIEMGQETAFSATEAGQAMLELLSSGSSLEESMAALPHVLNLAASSGLELGASADALTDILSQFQLGVEESESVVQSLSAATQKSSATMPDMVAAFQNVGSQANMMGLSVDETAAALAVLAENGQKGSEAGTRLNSMLLNMQRPTETVQQAWEDLGTSMYDAQGNMRPLDDIIDDINAGLADKTPEEANRIMIDLFGSYGLTAANALLASDGIDTMQTSMSEAADASTLADAKMNSFKGVVDQLKSSISTLSIVAIGPLVEDYIKPLIQQITPLLNELTAWMQANPELTGQIGLLLAALIAVGPVIFGLGTAFTILTSPLALISIGIIGLVAALGALYIAYENNLGGFADKVDSVAKVVIPVLEGIVDWVENIINAILKGDWDKAIETMSEGLENGLDTLLGIALDAGGWLNDNILQPLIDAIGEADWRNIITTIASTIFGLFRLRMAFNRVIKKWVIENILLPLGNAFIDWIRSGQAETDLSTFADGLLDILKGALDLTQEGLDWVIETYITPIIDSIVDYFASGQAESDFQPVKEAFNTILKSIMNLAGQGLDWIKENVINPLIDKIKDYFTSGEANSDLASLANALLNILKDVLDIAEQGLEWVVDNVISPIIDKVKNYFESGDAQSDFDVLKENFISLLKSALDITSDGLEWVVDNLITPLIDKIKDYFEGGDAETDGANLKDKFIELMKSALDIAEQGLEWVVDNVISPIITEIVAYATDGRLEQDMYSFGESTREFLIGALKFGAGGLAWVSDNIITPIVDALMEWITSGQAAEDLAAFGEGILDVIKTAADFTSDAATFINDKIIQPFIEGFLGLELGTLETAAGTIGSAIMDAIGGAITAAVSTVENAIKGAINDIVPNSFGFDLGSIDTPLGSRDLGSVSISIGEPFPGYAKGGNYPANRPRMVGEQGIEMDVPRSSGMIISNDQLATALNVLSAQARGGVFGSQGGNNASGGVTVNGGIQITIDKDAIPANATAEDVAKSVWDQFTQATRLQGGGTVTP